MAHLLIVGDKNCTFNKVLTSITYPEAKPSLRNNWRAIANNLDLSAAAKDEIDNGMDRYRYGIDWAMEKILENWRQSKSKQATLNIFLKALDDAGLFDIANRLRVAFDFPPKLAEESVPNESGSQGEDTLDANRVTASDPTPKDGSFFGKPKSRPEYPDLWNYKRENLINIDIPPPVFKRKLTDSDYKLSLSGQRFALIINIIQFKNPADNRYGGIYDSCNLNNLFHRLKYTIENHNDYEKDFTKSRLDSILTKFKTRCVENKAESFIVFIGSHGKYGNISLSNDDSVNLYDDIVYKMGTVPTDCPEWAEIPKVFIVSACRDRPRDSLRFIDNAIVCFSSLPNKPSYRDPEGGTDYIKCFVKTMMNEAHQIHFREILIMIENEFWKETNRQQPNHEVYGFDKCLYFASAI